MNRGFTLIELVVVIILLAILAVVALPRFVDLGEDAHQSSFDATYAAFRAAIKQSHLCWQLRGDGRDQEDLTCSADATYNSVDYNAQGYPAGTLEGGGTKSVGNQHDCLLIWDAILDSDQQVWSASDSRSPGVVQSEAEYESDYVGSQSCEYTLLAQPSLGFRYNSLPGEVTRL